VFERFTDRSRRAVVLAQEQARMLNHNYIGTEHLLLGVMGDPDCVGARALTSLDVSADEVRRHILEIVPEGRKPPSEHIPFTPRAKKVLELSLRQSVELGHAYLGTGHLLLGLVVEGEGVAAEVLRELGAWQEDVLRAVMEETEAAPAEEGLARTVSEPATEEELIVHARELAGLYDLSAQEVEAARRLLELDPREAKAQLALFVRFAKAFGVNPPALARFSRSDLGRSDAREEPPL
jgi:ATP-dependent Clp protease ATP-binding subunit ClpA